MRVLTDLHDSHCTLMAGRDTCWLCEEQAMLAHSEAAGLMQIPKKKRLYGLASI